MNTIDQNQFQVPNPFLLNCWKHHLGFIRHGLNGSIQKGGDSARELKDNLLLLGESQMDLYTGNLFPAEIAEQVKEKLIVLNCFEKSSFDVWINSPPGGYKTLVVSDLSEWTLRMGLKENYIHLHPSRYSKNTIRIKANTLKTIISVHWMLKVNQKPFSLEILNLAREEFFQASPVKSLHVASNIEKNLNLLFPE